MSLSVSPHINSSNYDEIKFPPVLAKKAGPRVFTLQLVNSKTDPTTKDLFTKATLGVLNVWRDVMASRRKMSEKADHMEQEKLVADQKLATTYENLLEAVEDQIDEIMGKNEKKSRHIMLLTDTDGQIQGIASVKERLEKIEVDTLLSAPWNVPMNSAPSDEHLPLRVKGSGTTLMRQIYEFAKTKRKQIVELRPIPTARSFYVDVLKMTPDNWSPALRFTVSAEEVPETLDVASGNLLNTL